MAYKREILISTIIMTVITAILVPYKLYSKQPKKRLFSSFVHDLSFATDSPAQKAAFFAEKQKEEWITIFIHGSFSQMLRRPNIKMFFDIIKDRLEGTFYQKTTQTLRANEFFRKSQPIQGLGLKKIDLATKPGNAAGAIASVYNDLDAFLYGRDKKHNHYYTFGWTGLITKSERYKSSEKLYKELEKELAKLREKGINPKIRFVCYSHGSNITVNLAKIRKKNNLPSTFHIDELILLAFPIRNGIDQYIADPMFKKVYSLYSFADRIQKVDFLGSEGSFFSRRKFIDRKNFKLPDNLTQIRIKMKRNRTTKKIWAPENDPRINYNIPSVLSGYSNLFRSASPHHIEWWFFNWARRGYRKNFPLSPFSIASLLPIIIDSVNLYGGNEKNLTLDLRPEQKIIMLKNKRKKRVTLMMLPEKKLAQIKEKMQKFSIQKRTKQQYEKQVDKAIAKAKIELAKH